jgi:succinate dehydrogenase flavin-adding protein (antitoxin of CptAB toxin-antitoxin module)
MKLEIDKKQLKQDFKRLFKSMDFVVDNYLNKEDPSVTENELEVFSNIYQQLGLLWDFLGLKCKHWDGFRKTKDKHEVCKICGKNKSIDDTNILLPAKSHKKIGRKLKPNSKNTFGTKKEAKILHDSIDFHGARLKVDVHNSYKSKLFGNKPDISIAAERTVQLKESGIECCIGQHTIDIQLSPAREKGSKPDYGNFVFEMRKKDLKHFPVILNFDDNFKFSGLTILRKR